MARRRSSKLEGGLVFGRDQGGRWCWWVTREGREQGLAPSVEPKVRHGFLQKPNDELYVMVYSEHIWTI